MKVLVYANVGLNLIDGSSIWVQSIIEVLSGLPGCDVIVISRDELEDRGVVPALRRIANLRIVSYRDYPDIVALHPELGDPEGIVKIIQRLDSEEALDRMIIRAPDVALRIARVETLRQRLWAYLLESPSLKADADLAQMSELVENAGGLIVQTDTQRGLLEAVFHAASNKTSVLPPMVKPVPAASPAERDNSDTSIVRFIYSGKYSITWNVETFFDVPEACAQAGVAATVTMIGDKVHNEKSDRSFRGRIMKKFTETPNVEWLGPMEREATIARAADHDLGLCWRTSALDDSLEISTKFLEFAFMGVPAVVNRTAAYENLLGEDYPYFAVTMDDVVSAATAVVMNRERHERIRDQCRKLAAGFTYEAASERLKNALRLRKPAARRINGSRIKVLVASHDLKFFNQALHWLNDSDRYEILHDRWSASAKHNLKQSEALLAQADVIFCEWCAGQAVWYSQRKLPGQKLFIRLHRYEAFTPFPREVEAEAIDGVIVVSDYLRDLCVREFGWPKDLMKIIPQYCVAEQFRREKHTEADRVLGLVGINGFLKRPDRAIEILRLVSREDPRFRLRIRSAMPWDIPWLWTNIEEKEKYIEFFSGLKRDNYIRGKIIFDRPGNNMAEWYRNVGYILSTSDIEGCHTAVAEGMCSGAMPIVINWPGATSVYDRAYVHETVEQMAEAILSASARTSRADEIAAIQAEAVNRFDISRTVDQLEEWFG